jgi:uroporphyrinogen III methyltransferase / synthase
MNLIGKRVLITRSHAQAEEFAKALIAEGARPVFFPVIEMVPPDNFSGLDHALRNLDQYDWLVLTSVHGVDAFFKRLNVLGIEQLPLHLLTAAVGSRTAQCLAEHGISPDHVPDEYTAEAILPGLGENIDGKRFLLPQSDLARTVLAIEIRSAGGIVDEVVAYRNVKGQPDLSAMNALRSGLDIITFTSPSTVWNFVDIVRKNGLDPLNLSGAPLFACIGPITKKAAEEAGFVNLIAAEKYTTDGLVEAIGKLVIN